MGEILSVSEHPTPPPPLPGSVPSEKMEREKQIHYDVKH